MSLNVIEQNVKQIRLTSGDEIVCELVENLEEELIVRHAFTITKFDASIDMTYYMFKPFMVYQDQPTSLIILSTFHILALAAPSKKMIDQYTYALETYLNNLDSDESGEEVDSQISYAFDSACSNVIQFDRSKIH